MATTTSIHEAQTPAPAAASLLVLLAAIPPDALSPILGNLTTAFPNQEVLVALSDPHAADAFPNLRVVPIPSTNATQTPAWTLTAADFIPAHDLAKTHNAQAILLLGPEAQSLSSAAIRALATEASSADLIVPCYDLPPHAGLVNSAILYPLTRALFATRIRFPLALDLALSPRMAERIAAVATQRFPAQSATDALLWPVNEAATANLRIAEIDAGPRTFPQPADADLNAILARVAGSLFADIDVKAAFWQRARTLPPLRTREPATPAPDTATDLAPMLEAFHLAYTNLLEIWSLVLPPNSLLGLKRLSEQPAASFRMPDALWARIVFDFLLAYRLRTLNRGHLMGALTPLYLAWVASHINLTTAGTTTAEEHIEAQVAAFETDKPYLVSRWRWPDRFNP